MRRHGLSLANTARAEGDHPCRHIADQWQAGGKTQCEGKTKGLIVQQRMIDNLALHKPLERLDDPRRPFSHALHCGQFGERHLTSL